MAEQKKFLIIFDMNGVLLSKGSPLNEYFSPNPIATSSNTIPIIHPSIDLEILGEFYSTHSFYMGIWTTAKMRNASSPFRILCDLMGVELDCFLTQENCSVGEMTGSIKTIYCIKDLRKPCELLNVKLENCMLFDDSEGKRCGNQNLKLFASDRRSILEAIKTIDEFICCNDGNCIAKRLDSFIN